MWVMRRPTTVHTNLDNKALKASAASYTTGRRQMQQLMWQKRQTNGVVEQVLQQGPAEAEPKVITK